MIRLLGGAHMARPYSSDLRERVVEAVNDGATRSAAAEHFGIGVSSAVRWHQAWRETGTFEAKRCGGSRSPLEDYAEEIIALVEEQRDRTLDEIVAAMHERRIPGSRTPHCRSRQPTALRRSDEGGKLLLMPGRHASRAVGQFRSRI